MMRRDNPRFTAHSALALIALAPALGCSEAVDGGASTEPGTELTRVTHQALSGEDGLADGFALFQEHFVSSGLSEQYRIGYGFHPGLSTERLTMSGFPVSGKATLNFDQQRVVATLDGVTSASAGEFELCFVKNVPGPNRNVQPELGDDIRCVGTFDTPETNGLSLTRDLSEEDIHFDFDLAVVSRVEESPVTSRILVGARTIFEKRFFHGRESLGPVAGPISNSVETTDELVRRGAFLFFEETFGGNGRTCGTCHREENNLTIDADFIDTLPATDPLFVSENDPNLAELEDPVLLREGLIRVNADGPDNPEENFVIRSTQHTFSLMTTIGIRNAIAPFPFGPPDHRLGWSGDGSPGRGTLNEFAFGAIMQHLTLDLERRPGIDFRIPTQEELDALEAFQLFTGRQKLVDANQLQMRNANVEQGRLALLDGNRGKCVVCHDDIRGVVFNRDALHGVEDRTGELAFGDRMPPDDGFKVPFPGGGSPGLGQGQFNMQPLVEAADSGPFFHNNVANTIEQAVAHYNTPEFNNTGFGLQINLTAQEQADIAAFLRVVNAAENLRQVRKRVIFIRDHRSSGNTHILDVALADTQDALDVLGGRNLHPAAIHALQTIKQTLEIAQANADADRPDFMVHALAWLDVAKNDLFAQQTNQF